MLDHSPPASNGLSALPRQEDTVYSLCPPHPQFKVFDLSTFLLPVPTAREWYLFTLHWSPLSTTLQLLWISRDKTSQEFPASLNHVKILLTCNIISCVKLKTLSFESRQEQDSKSNISCIVCLDDHEIFHSVADIKEQIFSCERL